MEAVIYARVSSDPSGKGKSTQDQEKECRQECERNGWPVRAVFVDNDIGASRHSGKERPAWATLKSELRNGDILVCWEASRPQRDLEEYVLLRNLCAELNVPLSYAGRVLDLTLGDDRFVGGLDALLAERESEQIRTRVLRGKRGSAAAGRPSTRPPWGYQLVRPGEWKIDPVEGPRVREAIARILSGESLRSTLLWLTETPGYTPSSLTNLRRAVCNPAYAGLRVHQGEVTGRGTWTPLITEAQHHQLVEFFRRMKIARGHGSPPGPEPKHLLSGIAICGKCKKPLRHKLLKGRSPGYACNDGHCHRVAEAMDRMVEKELFHRLSHVDPKEFENDDPGVVEALQEIEDIEKNLEKWFKSAEAEEVTPAAYGKMEKIYLERIERLRPKTLGKRRPHQLPVDKLAANWPKLSMREKREIVKRFYRITVNPVGKGKWRDAIHGVEIEEI